MWNARTARMSPAKKCMNQQDVFNNINESKALMRRILLARPYARHTVAPTYPLMYLIGDSTTGYETLPTRESSIEDCMIVIMHTKMGMVFTPQKQSTKLVRHS